jgi:hypothetical protein
VGRIEVHRLRRKIPRFLRVALRQLQVGKSVHRIGRLAGFPQRLAVDRLLVELCRSGQFAAKINNVCDVVERRPRVAFVPGLLEMILRFPI